MVRVVYPLWARSVKALWQRFAMGSS